MATNEANVISAVCKNKDIHIILGEDAEIFGGYGDVFSFIKEYYIKHKAIPETQLLEEKFDDVEFVPTSGPTAYYMEELRAGYVRSRMEEIMMKASGALDTRAAPDVLGQLTTSLAKLGKFTNSVRDLNMTDYEDAQEHFKHLREISEANDGSPGISTGFKSIDCAYPTGMAPGHSIILIGYPGRGKSMWSALLGVKAWQQGKKVMIISLEMTPEEYRKRVYAMMSSGLFTINDLARGDVNDDDFRTWGKKELAGSADYIVVSGQGMTEMTPNVIQAKIDTHRPDVVICHEYNTDVCVEGQWMKVQEHPSATSRLSDGIEILVRGEVSVEVVTPEHQYWVMNPGHGRYQSGSEPMASPSRYKNIIPGRWVRASDITTDDFIGYKISTDERPAPNNIGLPTSRGRGFNDQLQNEEFWWFVGLWLGDGDAGGNGGVGLSMANSRPELKERLANFLSDGLGVKYRVVTSNENKNYVGMEKYEFTHTNLMRWLISMHRGNSIKTLPSWAETLPLSLQAAMVAGYVDADGHVNEKSGGTRITSVNLNGLRVIKRILARLGLAASISVNNKKEYTRVFPNGKLGHCKKSYSLGWNQVSVHNATRRFNFILDGFLWSKARSISHVESRVFVPIQTPDHTYHTNFGMSHNCDYLQLMMDNSKTTAMTPRMLNLSREIKLMAVSNNIPIVSVSSVTDEDHDKRDSPPVLSQVSWSSGIEYDANLAIAIHRHDNSNIVEVICRKNRDGDMFGFYFDVDFNKGLWVEKHDLE